MALRVLKFGGTSVETPERILAVARRIRDARRAGDDVIAVVSAMGQTTDELIRLAHRVSRTPHRRELDMLLTSGERITMALVAMALESLGCPAISFTGSQSGIITDERHFDARIRTIRPGRIERELAEGKVVIVAGFQGVSDAKEITTLGRGGSDTTAVALAIRFDAGSCEIFTDVAGVLSADPRVVPDVERLPEVSYEAMVVLSHLGGRVLFRRAAILARRFALPLVVASSQGDGPGTRIFARGARRRTFGEETGPMESDRCLAVALESPVRWVRAVHPHGERESRGDASESRLLYYFESHEGLDGERIETWVESADGADGRAMGSTETTRSETRPAALVSLVGEGVMSDPARIHGVRGCLTGAGIEVWALQASSLAISAVVREADGERASRVLHERFLATRADALSPGVSP